METKWTGETRDVWGPMRWQLWNQAKEALIKKESSSGGHGESLRDLTFIKEAK